MIFKKSIVLLFYVLLHGYFIFYTNDLEQKNKATLFLSSKGLDKYKLFKKQIDEKKIIVLGLNYQKDIEQIDYEQFLLKTKNIKNKYPDIQIVDFETIYAANLAAEKRSFEQLLRFSNKNDLLIPLLQKRMLGLILIIANKLDNSQISHFISDLDNVYKENGVQVQMSGPAYTNYHLDIYSKQIKEKLFPLMFILTFFFTWFFTGRPMATFIIFLPALFSFIETLTFIKYFYSDLNMITSISPLLVFVINLSLCFHLYFSGLEYGSFKQAIKEKWAPCLLMVLTTSIGFGSLILSEILVIRHFGIISFFSILISCGLSLFWMTFVLPFYLERTDAHWPLIFRKNIVELKKIKRNIIILASVIITVLFLYCLPRVDVMTDATQYFPDSSGIRKSMIFIQQNLFGNPNYEISMAKKNGLKLNFDDLKQLSSIEQEISNKLSFSKKILSHNAIIKEANKLYSGNYSIPDFEISYQMINSKINQQFVSLYPVDTFYRMTLLGTVLEYSDFTQDLNHLNEILQKYPAWSFTVNGLYYNLISSQNKMILVLVKSFFMSLLIISFISYFYFRKIRMLFVFLYVNTFPILILIIFMYLTKIRFNIATIMTFSIALGMIVDSTFHISYGLLKGHDSHRIYRTTLAPILASTVLLCCSLILFAFNQFLPIKQFGICLSFVLFVALIFDLYILPTLVTPDSNF